MLAAGLSGIILYTSLGGTTYAWDSPGMPAALVGGVALFALFPLAESRAAEPIPPLELFRNAPFRTASAIGFVIGSRSSARSRSCRSTSRSSRVTPRLSPAS